MIVSWLETIVSWLEMIVSCFDTKFLLDASYGSGFKKDICYICYIRYLC